MSAPPGVTRDSVSVSRSGTIACSVKVRPKVSSVPATDSAWTVRG